MNDGSVRERWHRAIVALSLFFVLALAAEGLGPAIAQAKSKRPHGVHGQVVGGHPVPQGELTFMAYIFAEVEEGGLGFFCGGSLIDASHVLTAAHCTIDPDGNPLNPDAFHVTIGTVDLNDFDHGVDRDVVQLVQHPDWDPDFFTRAYDVAVLELDNPVPSTVAQPLRLVSSGQSSADTAGKVASVAGWGRTCTDCPDSDQLLETDVQLVSDSACSEAYGDDFVPSVMICAGAPGRDSCQGDSGGPLFIKEQTGTKKIKQSKAKHDKHKKAKRHKHKKRKPIFANFETGIVSFGADCADPNFPGVYTRLSAPQINNFITGTLNS